MTIRSLAFLTTLLLLAATPAQAATVTRITVAGEGTVAVMPDQASVRAAVENTADTAEAAVSQTNVTYARAVDAVVALGIARNDITLAYYNFNYNPRPVVSAGENLPPGRYGYIVTRGFDVKVRDVNKAGAVVDALTKAGVTNVENVAFTAADPSHARSQATAKAMADARTKAQEIAHAAGLHITGISRISYGTGSVIQPLMRAAVMSAPAPTTFDQGSVTVNEMLTVVFLAQP